MLNVSLVGCTGIVGNELLKLLEKKNFPVRRLRLFASKSSFGKKISFKGNPIAIESIQDHCFTHEDLIFFCTEESISQKVIPKCLESHAVIIDLSSAFREEENIPLIIPEINFDEIKNHRLIASPNCMASIIAFVIANIHKKYTVKRIIASTYQAASGGGADLLQKLIDQSRHYLKSSKKRSDSIAFNTYLHNSRHFPDRYSFEEKKIINEVRKILKAPEMKMSVTSVRIPVMRAHAASLNIECLHSFAIRDVECILQNTKGLSLVDNYELSKFATSLDASEKEEVFCSRVRLDQSLENTLELWVVADQLLKGAALNALQIAEKIVEKNLVEADHF